MPALTSSNLQSADYSGGILIVAFRGGRVYAYFHVPYAEYVGLMQAGSHGKYLHARIKNRYPFKRIK